MNWIFDKDKGTWCMILLSIAIGVSMYLLPTNVNAKFFIGIIALGLILWRVEIGLILAVLAMPFITFKYISLLMFYTFGCFFLKKLYKKETISFTPIDGYLLAFFLVLTFSAVFSITKNQSMKELFVYISILLMVFMVTRSRNQKTLNQLLMFFILAATLVALYGIYQYLTGAVGGHGWVDVKTNPNLKARAYSTMDNPNILAEYLVIAGSFSVALFLSSKNIYRKIFLLGTTCSIVLCLVLTFSRGGWIAFFLSMFIVLASENKKMIPIGILLGFVSLFFLPDVVLDRIKTIGSVKDSSNAYRFLIWSAAMNMLKDFWASGVGLGYAAFMKIYPNYTLAGIKAAHAHNAYLQIAIETGIFGLLAFLMNVLKAYMIGIYNVYQSTDPFFKRISVAAIGAISGLMVHGMVEHILFDYRVIFSFWLAIAIIIASYKNMAFDKEGRLEERRYEI